MNQQAEALSTHLLLGAAMRIISLPEASHVAPDIAGHALRKLKARIPAQRTVAEHPDATAGGARSTSADGTSIPMTLTTCRRRPIVANFRVAFLAAAVVQLKESGRRCNALVPIAVDGGAGSSGHLGRC